MNYWLTTHWPPRIGDDPSGFEFGVWISDRCKKIGKDLHIGDQVLIYESRSGRTEVYDKPDGSTEYIGCQTGKEGIISVCETTTDVYELKNSKPSKYANGSEVWWRWHAELKLLSRSGFVPRKEINKILRYKSNYNFRGFGNMHSGLKNINKDEFNTLVDIFKGKITIQSNLVSKGTPNQSGFGAEESKEHRNLKLYVAANPEVTLSEKGVTTLEVEYSFPTMDKADIMLTDQFGKIIGVEIEVSVNDGQYEGLLQAIKYRYMGELITKRRPGDSRAVLIAYTVAPNMKHLCSDYNITCIEVNKHIVDKWAENNIEPTKVEQVH